MLWGRLGEYGKPRLRRSGELRWRQRRAVAGGGACSALLDANQPAIRNLTEAASHKAT